MEIIRFNSKNQTEGTSQVKTWGNKKYTIDKKENTIKANFAPWFSYRPASLMIIGMISPSVLVSAFSIADSIFFASSSFK